MIKTDSSQQTLFENGFAPFFSIKTVLIGLCFGVLGAITNTFLYFHFIGNFTVYFGQIFVLLCLVNRGLNVAIISVLISSIAAAWNANDSYLVVIFSLEMLFIHVSMRKGHFLFRSAVTFWLMIGAPLFIVLHAITSDVSAEILFIGSVSLALNSLICVSIVAVICWFLPSPYIYEKYYTRPPPLASLIFSILMLAVTLPVMLIALYFIWQSSIQNEENSHLALANSVDKLIAINDTEMQRHLSSVITVSDNVGKSPQTDMPALIGASVDNHQLFYAIMVTDIYGKVVRATPRTFSVQLNNLPNPSVQTRNYVTQARYTKSAFITDATVDKGLGENLITYFVAPYTIGAEFGGIVQGAMHLTRFSHFISQNLADDYLFVITDKKGRIIAHSKTLNMPLLSNFDFAQYQDPLFKQLTTMALNNSVYAYKQSNTFNGWTITVLQPTHELSASLVKHFTILLLYISGAFAMFTLFAKSLSRRITKPLLDVANIAPHTQLTKHVIRNSQVSSEIVMLRTKLIDSHKIMTNFNQKLSEQVQEKTSQLTKLNRELYSIAQKDSLTQLLNRAGFNRLAMTSYRNCLRNHTNMSLILIDIDHFKRINDTFGHPFGDKCIMAVAEIIQQHCKRDTDIIGRYGGEEFILMIVGGELIEHTERIGLIKDDIQNSRFNTDQDSVKLTISAGVCSVTDNFSIEFLEMLQLSDNQLYISKHKGRNKISSIVK